MRCWPRGARLRWCWTGRSASTRANSTSPGTRRRGALRLPPRRAARPGTCRLAQSVAGRSIVRLGGVIELGKQFIEVYDPDQIGFNHAAGRLPDALAIRFDYLTLIRIDNPDMGNAHVQIFAYLGEHLGRLVLS